jgi:hypothetical protein
MRNIPSRSGLARAVVTAADTLPTCRGVLSASIEAVVSEREARPCIRLTKVAIGTLPSLNLVAVGGSVEAEYDGYAQDRWDCHA